MRDEYSKFQHQKLKLYLNRFNFKLARKKRLDAKINNYISHNNRDNKV